MGHMPNPDREYRLLQQRLDRNIVGAPDSPEFTKILKMLFTPEEADLARRLPTAFAPLNRLSRQLGIPLDELDDKMSALASKGLVIDIESDGERYFSLSPVVIGFFEFTLMRTGEELPMKELAGLFETYMDCNDRFARSAFEGQTQIGRALVREETLPANYSEVLDWERASSIIKSAPVISLALCQCRHKAKHLGKACDAPERACLAFNFAAEYLIRHGFAQQITNREAMRVLGECKEAGLAQICDNVQRNVTYICNCCGCCCEMLTAIKTFNLPGGVVTSNWIMQVNDEKCTGCGRCAAVCPLQAIEMVDAGQGREKFRRPVLEQSACLGCGVCHTACKSGAIIMKSRPKRVITPETAFDRVVSMAVERGKLTNILFENPEKLSHRALGRIIGILEKSSPFKAAMAIQPLKSVFLKGIVQGAKWKLGKIGKIL